MTALEHTDHDNRSPEGFVFWISLVIGWCVGAFGIWSLFENHMNQHQFYTFKLAFGANIFHDAIVAPFACVVGFALTKLIPRSARSHVKWAVGTTAVFLLIGFIPITQRGFRADNRSIEPLDYATSVLTAIAVVWAIALVLIVAGMMRSHQPSATTRPEESPSSISQPES